MITPGHVVITGAAGAIGSALARAMRTAWPGVELALVDRDAAALQALRTELGGSTTAYTFDLRALAEIDALVTQIERKAPIDGLVNCAGIMHVQQLATWKWQDAQALLAVDLLAPLELQQRLVPGMIERGAGVIVNIASMAGRVPLKGGTYYCASKAGLAMASEIARSELATHGVRVVTVYPGPVKSALEQGARDAYGGGGVLGRFVPTGEPSELARRIMSAIDRDEPRVIYPSLYGVGWTAPNLSGWLSLSYGPPPIS
ncbi:MAG: oxidoreductase, short-chain dehydrogenase/reductase family protein [Myxococcales bacterium]|nr:oxidoreductase, short-chain dehydrogenase/reductase family protein [Myxococcales bacterium]